MDRGDVRVPRTAERRRDVTAPVATLRDKAVVAEAFHQAHEDLGYPRDIDTGPLSRAGESEARKGGNDHIEGINGIAAVTFGVCQRADHLVHLEDRSRPAVRDEERDRLRTGSFHVNEVDVARLQDACELRKAVQEAFLCAPVKLVQPVVDELLHVTQLRAVRPPRPRYRVRPACVR